MIKLTFQLVRTVERAYESSRVVIGLGSPDLVDIPIDTSLLHVDHLVILDSDGEFWALNPTNDPFVTVNSRPFGRKLLRNGDRLLINDIAIAFEGEAQSPPSVLATIAPILERKIQEQQKVLHKASVSAVAGHGEEREIVSLLEDVEALAPLPSAKVVDAISQRADHAIFDSLLTEVTALEEDKPHPPVRTVPSIETRKSPLPKQESATVSEASAMSWQMWLAMASAICLLISLVAIGIFTALNEQSDQQEYLAAQDLADIAMALTYAQIHQLQPQSHNWTDPDFIMTNVERVLDGQFNSNVVINAQGYLNDNPYLVRIYTNQDASQFLLMAQPAFSVWHWFSRKHTILLDSTAMELRRTTDLRALNRLMANPNALIGANALDVSRLVAEADLISLKTLARETHQREFIPPRELKVIRPGADHLIHNAPRYYRFGESVLESLAATAHDSTAEIKGIKDQLQRFRRLSSLVLYAEKERVAKQALDNLQEFFPNESVMVGYLTFQRESGAYIASQLLSQSFSVLNPPHEQEKPFSFDHYLYGQ